MTSFHPPRTAPAPRRIGAGLASAAGLLALLLGVPALLALVVGWPLPHALPTLAEIGRVLSAPLDEITADTLAVNTLAVLAWLAWAQFAVCVAVETRAALRHPHLPARRVPGPRHTQLLAHQLVTAVLALAVSTAGRHPAAPVVETRPAVVMLPATDAVVGAEPVTATSSAPAAAPAQDDHPRYVVRPGDTLWDIAGRHLGDPLRYKEIVKLNTGRPQPGGGSVHGSGDDIRPGWTLRLPHDATGLPDPAAPRPEPPACPPTPPAAPRPADARPDRATPPTVRTPTGSPSGTPAPPGTATATPGPSTAPPAADTRPRPVAPVTGLVSAGFAAGLATAAAIGRLRRRRATLPGPPAPGLRHEPAPGETIPPVAALPLRADPEQPPAAPPLGAGTVHMDDPDPGVVDLALRDGQPVSIDLATCGGLSVSGPAGDDVARALLLALLARGGPNAVEVLATPEALDRLLPGEPELPVTLRRLPYADAVAAASAETLRRARFLDRDDITDFGAYRQHDPAEAMTAYLLLVTAPVNDPDRLRATLVAGRRFGIGALILGDTDLGSVRLVVGDGIEATPETLAGQLAGAAPCRLGPADALAALAVLAAARPADETVPPPPPPEPEPFEAPPPEPGRPLAVQLLGAYRIHAAGTEIRSGLRTTARELLAYYLLRPEGATQEAAIDALWPDLDEQQGKDRFRNAVRSLRGVLRPHLDGADAKIIEPAQPLFRVQTELFTVDLWIFQHHLRQAANAPDEAAAIAELAAAADLYRGDLLDGLYHEWAAPQREHLRRQAVDALARLADLAERHRLPDAALAALDRAIAIDPVAEPLYQRAIRIHARLRQPDAARRLYRQLQNNLLDIDAEPNDKTEALLMEANPGQSSARIPAGSPDPCPTMSRVLKDDLLA